MAAESPKSIGQIYFIADDKIYSWREAFEIIGGVLNKRTIPLRIPKSLVIFMALLSESFCKLLGRSAAFNVQKAKEITQRYWILDVSKAKDDLGFHPKYHLEKGAEETVRWYREMGWL